MPPNLEALKAPRVRVAAALAAGGALVLTLSGGDTPWHEQSGRYSATEASPTPGVRAYGDIAVGDCTSLIYATESSCLIAREPVPSPDTQSEHTQAPTPTDIRVSPHPSSTPSREARVSRSQKRREVVLSSPRPKPVVKSQTVTPSKAVVKTPVTVAPKAEGGQGRVIRIPDWDTLAQCESSGNVHINTGNGFYGLYQFDYSTWLSNGGGKYASRADLATKAQQTEIAQVLFNARGPQPWPGCTRKTNWERIVRTVVIR